MNKDDLTTLVNAQGSGSGGVESAWSAHYSELRRIAAQCMSREKPGQSLQPTALVHEAFVRMVDRSKVTAKGSAFFRACFATECRRILIDAARKRGAKKRGGGVMSESVIASGAGLGVDADVLDLHEAIERLGTYRARLAKVVDLRVFGGLTVPECADALSVSTGTVDSDWRFARSWLRQQLQQGQDH